MDIVRFPDSGAVATAIRDDEPLMAVIAFDGKNAVAAPLDEAVEHHILLMKAGCKDTDIDRFFRIVFDRSGADWTFVCPPDYKDIPFKDKRIRAFYRDGLGVIGEFLQEMGYITGINIPKRYSRHLDVLSEDVY
jgi:hypothetical protein